jgi:bifunctional UDP-N-acetylglucosamine pyrophosphorylase/glucosamine-1-phosphate N-acetyltransferase
MEDARMKDRFVAAILAAGEGTRFRSQRAKVLHTAGGRTLIEHVVRAAKELSPHAIFVIVGHQADAVTTELQKASFKVRFLRQKDQKGTGHALLCGRKELERAAPRLLVLYGDTPLLAPDTLRRFLDFHASSNCVASVLTAEMEDPAGYGRIIRAPGGAVAAIVEHKSASPAQLQIREINTGIYCFQTKELFAALGRVIPDPITKEYYLTDVIGLLTQAGHRVAAFRAPDPSEVVGINNRAELARVDSLLRLRKARKLMLSGVTIHFPETARIDPDVAVGPDSEIEPGVSLLGRTRIGKNCRIGAWSVITDSELAGNVTIRPSCVITESKVAEGASVGPFAHLRPGADIGPQARIGDFVEVKKSRIGRGSRALHLAYIGDAVIGKNVNVSAGTITVNYDGVNKHQTIVEDNAFVGSGSNLIAPVRVGRNAFVAAGSTITDEVPANALAIARSRQTNKPGWVKKRRRKSTKNR